jgi:hypothetical protein
MRRVIYFAGTVLIRSVDCSFFLSYGAANVLVKPSQSDWLSAEGELNAASFDDDPAHLCLSSEFLLYLV